MNKDTAPHGERSKTSPTAGYARAIVVLSDALDRIVEASYVATTVIFASVMMMGVFFRYALNNSLPWSDELALIFFIWAAFLSIATTYRHGRHINVDFLVRKLSPTGQARLAVVSEGLTGAYLICLLVSGTQALPIAAFGHTDALRLPVTVPYMAIPVASVVMLVHWVRRNLVDLHAGWGVLLLKSLIVVAFFSCVYFPLGQHLAVVGMPRFWLILLTFMVPLLIGVPVAFALGLVATTYLAVFGTMPFNNGALQMYFGIEHMALLSIPLLILAGSLMHTAGMSRYMVDFAQVIVGRLRGGLGASNVVASFIFGDISGSAVSDTAAIGSQMIPEMKKRGYRADFCAALQGAGGTLGMTAPLSITLILYCTVTNTSVSRLAAATIAPAFVVASSFMLIALLHARRHNYPREHVPRDLVLPRLLRAMPGLFALVLVVGGVLGGVFTPAEVGTILLLYVGLLSVFLYRTGQPRQLYQTTVRAGHISGMTLLLISTSAFLGFMLGIDRVGYAITETVLDITSNQLFIIAIISVVFVILGMVLEAAPIIFSFMPSFMPLLQTANIDFVHWGVLFVINMGLGMLVPPVALNLFVSSAIAEVRYEQAVRAALVFMVIMAADIALIAVFPQIALMLPNVLYDYPMPQWPYFGR